jgi:uncharacterized Fe-S center protein
MKDRQDRAEQGVLSKEVSRREFLKKATSGAAGLTALFALGPRAKANAQSPSASGGSRVYFTADISGKGLLAAYRALGVTASGKVAVKLHMGERGNTNYLNPAFLRDLVTTVNGSFCDSNTYYGGARGTTANHLAVAKEHGFTYAPVDILDTDGSARIPIPGGVRLKEAIVGKHILDYDWIVSVAHFKGHSMAGFGGSFKNMAVGIASPEGKAAIHGEGNRGGFSSSGDSFFEKIIEYNAAMVNAKKGRILFINVLNNLSVSCDCDAGAPKATMPDIGILSSTDPVALEKASLDLIYARPQAERKDLVERIESKGGVYQITYAEKLGLGTQKYQLVRL